MAWIQTCCDRQSTDPNNNMTLFFVDRGHRNLQDEVHFLRSLFSQNKSSLYSFEYILREGFFWHVSKPANTVLCRALYPHNMSLRSHALEPCRGLCGSDTCSSITSPQLKKASSAFNLIEHEDLVPFLCFVVLLSLSLLTAAPSCLKIYLLPSTTTTSSSSYSSPTITIALNQLH